MNESMKSGMTTKTCSKCFSEIDARAVKCLKCHSGQLTLKFVHFAIPVFALAAFVAGIIWIDMRRNRRDWPPGPNYATNTEVVSSRLFFVPHEESHQVMVVGLLKNTGKTAIGLAELELRITDADGSLIDAVSQTVRTDLPAGDEASFKVKTREPIHLSKSEYAQHRIIIRAAYE